MTSPTERRILADREAGQGGAGFTLLELLVVLAILGVVLAVAPSLMAGSGTRVRGAARDLAADLRGLRSDAIRLRTVEGLELEPGGYRPGGGASLHALPAGTTLRFAPAMPPLVGETARRIAFYPDGSSTGGTVTLVDRGMSIVVRVFWLDGRVAVDE